jgi:hypothetical protein
MARLYRMSFGGNLPGGDIFDYGLHALFDDATLPPAVLTTMEAGLVALLTTASGIQSQYDPNTKWVRLSAVEIDPVDGSSGLAGEQATAHQGTNVGATALPGQMCVVVSHRTNGFGKTDRGRMYLPALQVSAIGANTRLQAAVITQLNVSLAAFYHAIKTATAPATPVVYSTVLRSSKEIVRYDFGDRMDVQRSRANKLVEGRSGAAI